MFKDRILKLAAAMERIEPAQYDQRFWLGWDKSKFDQSELIEVGEDFRIDGYNYVTLNVKEGACGTAACILGNAVAALPEANLFFLVDEDFAENLDEDMEMISVGVRDENGVVRYGHRAAQVALGIPRRHAEVLFSHPFDRHTNLFYENDFSPENVAKKLREYVETDGENVERLFE